MHQLSKLESEALSFLNAESKHDLREQKIRLDQEFSQMLGKIASRKIVLLELEEKLANVDKSRQMKDEELRSLERKLVVLLEEQQIQIDLIKNKQNGKSFVRGSNNSIENKSSQAMVLTSNNGGRGGGGGQIQTYVGPSAQEKKQVAQLMQSAETLMRFGFMSMSMTYFSSLNMIQALRTVSAQDTVMAAVAESSYNKQLSLSSSSSSGINHVNTGSNVTSFQPDLQKGQMPGQEATRVSAWSVQDVAKWLNTLCLGQYAEAFIDAAIDGQFLYDLDDEDLENSLGIEHRLHRKKILGAVRNLKAAEIEADKKLEAMYSNSTVTADYQVIIRSYYLLQYLNKLSWFRVMVLV
jgi:hypothetical protein